MTKVKVNMKLGRKNISVKYDGVLLIGIDKTADGGVDVNTHANIPLEAGLKALEEAIEKEAGTISEDDDNRLLN